MAWLLQDIRYGARLLVRSPSMTAVVALSLALGIGANTTIFTLVNAVLLSPLPVRDATRLVRVVTTEVRNGAVTPLGAISRPNALDVRDRNTVFEAVAAAGFAQVALSSGGEPEQVFAQLVTGNYFDVLGPRLAAGRTFLPDEDTPPGASPGADRAVVRAVAAPLRRRHEPRRPAHHAERASLHGDRRDRRRLSRHRHARRPRAVGADVDVPRGAHRATRSTSTTRGAASSTRPWGD